MSNNAQTTKKIPVKLIILIIILGAFVGIFLRILTVTPTENQELYKDMPTFTLPKLLGQGNITNQDIQSQAPVMVNIWASWCAPCRQEHPLLEKLSEVYHIPIIGLNYKDKADNAKKFIAEHGNPYADIANDAEGLTTLNWGIRGVPETFIINKEGKIIYRHTGEIREQDIVKLVDKFEQAR